jgi:hypothetical protein
MTEVVRGGLVAVQRSEHQLVRMNLPSSNRTPTDAEHAELVTRTQFRMVLTGGRPPGSDA